MLVYLQDTRGGQHPVEFDHDETLESCKKKVKAISPDGHQLDQFDLILGTIILRDLSVQLSQGDVLRIKPVYPNLIDFDRLLDRANKNIVCACDYIGNNFIGAQKGLPVSLYHFLDSIAGLTWSECQVTEASEGSEVEKVLDWFGPDNVRFRIIESHCTLFAIQAYRYFYLLGLDWDGQKVSVRSNSDHEVYCEVRVPSDLEMVQGEKFDGDSDEEVDYSHQEAGSLIEGILKRMDIFIDEDALMDECFGGPEHDAEEDEICYIRNEEQYCTDLDENPDEKDW